MSKVSVIARIPLKPGTKGDLIAAFTPMLEQVNDEAGTEIYILCEDRADENVVWVYELYSDSEALDAHSSSDAMAALLGVVGGLVDGDPGFHILNPIAGKGL
ncbi:MAG: putative quinol monooxygenase [Acidimicrobiaceae bacterium]|nr:antibiotic biosynthesis monooxygenase [Acidimicrobiia bacterium]MCY4492524.1 putative quinol monooxygenase [Acidimicrobiaceae bacterium]